MLRWVHLPVKVILFLSVSLPFQLAAMDAIDESALVDKYVQTAKRFPIEVAMDLEEGPLLTLTHDILWGCGHKMNHYLFFNKKSGYGLDYRLPTVEEIPLIIGGQCYKQTAKTYAFYLKDIWFSCPFAPSKLERGKPTYWFAAVGGYDKQFAKQPTIAGSGISYMDSRLFLCKLGLVSDAYQASREGVYTLHKGEHLPKGGAIEVTYGYQKVPKNTLLNRHYVAISGIKNIVHASCRYLHVAFATAVFLHRNHWEEGILKGTLAYAPPLLHTGRNATTPFIRMDYIAGCRLPKTKRLAIFYRDPEELDLPDKADLAGITQPIHARFNLALHSRLHRPINYAFIRFALLGFVNFIALYGRDYALLNSTLVEAYGIGLRLAHNTIREWPTIECKIGYSPLFQRLVPSIGLAICTFKNLSNPKPMLVAYS
ncbi:MAG: hypothetical protein NQ127_03235 [Candidatus Cardinium sp.]|nr:hypothetical protein [Candidatus Cardinium sp.]